MIEVIAKFKVRDERNLEILKENLTRHHPTTYYGCEIVDDGQPWDEEKHCPGHESTDGPIGNVVYCDGSCQPPITG